MSLVRSSLGWQNSLSSPSALCSHRGIQSGCWQDPSPTLYASPPTNRAQWVQSSLSGCNHRQPIFRKASSWIAVALNWRCSLINFLFGLKYSGYPGNTKKVISSSRISRVCTEMNEIAKITPTNHTFFSMILNDGTLNGDWEISGSLQLLKAFLYEISEKCKCLFFNMFYTS